MTDPLFKIGDVVDVWEGLTQQNEKGTIINSPVWETINGIEGWYYEVMTETRYSMEKTKCIGWHEMRYPVKNELRQWYREYKGQLVHSN